VILERYGRFVVRRRKPILVVTLLGSLLGVVALASLPPRLKYELFVAPNTDAFKGTKILKQQFGEDVPNLLFLVTAKDGSVDDPAVVAEATALVGRLVAERDVADVVSYWTAGRAPSLRSESGRRGLVVGRILGTGKQAVERAAQLRPLYNGPGTVIDVRMGGELDFYREYEALIRGSLKKSEIFTGPVILAALLVIFGSAVAASLPLLIAAIAVVGTGAVLYLLSLFASVSSFSLFLTSILALGLGLDYSLFVVSRFREEMNAGHNPADAVVRSIATAGRTVIFSAAAVGIALAALLGSPMSFMRSFGYSGIATAVTASLGALVVLPALLAVLGPNVNRWTVWRRSIQPPDGSGLWHRVAVTVMRRPVPIAAGVLAVLLLVAIPVLHLRPGLTDDRDLPTSAHTRVTGDILRAEFGGREGTPLPVVLPGVVASERAADLDRFAAAVARLPGVIRVDAATGEYTNLGKAPARSETVSRLVRPQATYLNVVSSTEPLSPESERLINTIRALPSPFPRVLVTGTAANAYDVKTALVRSLPPAVLFIALATFLALFLQFGSILVPLKAILLNILSLSALFGLLVWLFQDGHLSGVLGITTTGTIYISIPIIIFVLAFGLSMDYEVFLLSRIKEEYDRTGDNEASVAMGLEKSGRIVSAAAILIALVFLTTAVVGVTAFEKALGIGLGLVVLGDAFVIRGTLVPAFMKMAGSANWWAPGPLRRLHDRVGISEHIDLDVDLTVDTFIDPVGPVEEAV
jgi:RND superfamily putative drug exporter